MPDTLKWSIPGEAFEDGNRLEDWLQTVHLLNGDLTMKPARQALSAIVIASVLLLSAQPAEAQQVCAPHKKAALQLEKTFDEQVVGRGLMPDGKAMFELFVSESGSWTVLVSDLSGQSCVSASGDSWQRIPLLVGDPA